MSAFEDSMLDFDIDFLHPSVITAFQEKSQNDKRNKQVQLCKKKIVGTDVLLKNHYICKEKLEAKEVMFLTAKEECKQVCIDYQDVLEKYTQSEKELHTLKKQYAEVESKCTLYQNQYEGMKSHANQLQLLVKEHVSNIEALKVEKHLEQNNSDDYNKDLTSKQKEIEVLLKHLNSLGKDNAFKMVGKKLRKRHKVLLQQYENLRSISSEDDASSDSGNDQPDFFDDSPHSPLFTPPEGTARGKNEQNLPKEVSNTNKMEICIKKDSTKLNEDNDSDFNNEVVSVDTGRGSSLEFSDGEKCFNSPDYFSNDSPIAKEINKESEKTLVDTGTSPIRCQEEVHIARSPRIFDDDEYFITDIPLNDEIVTIKEKRKMIDIGTSPFKDLEKVNIATSPLLFDECVEQNIIEVLPKSVATDYQTSDHVNGECQSYINNRKTPCILIDDTVPIVKSKDAKSDNFISHCELEITGKSIEERKCLERNNSIDFCDENSNDGEIEMILNTMRLTQRLITPIPETPVNNRKIEIRRKEDRENEYLRLREENKIILSSVNEVKKAMMDLQCLFLNQLNKDKSKVVSNISVNTKIFDDTSQGTIIINSYNDDFDNENEESEVNTTNFSNTLKNDVPQELQQQILKQVTPSSASKLRDILPLDASTAIDDSIEKESSTVNINDVAHVTKNNSHEALTFEEDLISEDEIDIIINDNVDHNAQNWSVNCSKIKKIKNKKLSKLDKFKQKMLPKSKISNSASIRKLRSKSKLAPVIKKVSQLDATAILNNKSAYEHAAKVLAEIKSKDKDSASKKRVARTAKKAVDGQNYHVDNIECLEQQELTSENEENNPEKHIRRESNDQYNDKHLESVEDDECSPVSTRSRNRKLSSNYCVSPASLSEKEGNNPEKHIRRKSNDLQYNDKHLESVEDDECSSVSTRIRSRKLSSNCFVSPTLLSEKEGNNPEKHIRRKSNDLQYNDKHLESVEDDECSSVSTRSRSRKLSSNYCVSPTSICEKEGNNPEKRIRRKSNDLQYNDKHLESVEDDECSPITTRSRSRKLSSNYCVSPTSIDTRETSKSEEKRKRLKRGATDSPIFHSKRVLRSSNNRNTFVDLDTVRKVVSYNDIDETFSDSPKSRNHNSLSNSTNEKLIIRNDDINNSPHKTQDGNLSKSKNEDQNSIAKNVTNSPKNNHNRKLCQGENEQTVNNNVKNISYAPNSIQNRKPSDLNSAIEERTTEVTDADPSASQISHPKQSILCRMLEKHGRGDSKSSHKKVADNITDSICKKLEESIAFINELPPGKVKPAMNKLVEEVQSWDVKHFMLGFMKYLKDPDRKRELFNKVNSPPAPPMTKSEQVLLYVVRQMEMQAPNTVNVILAHIEFSLFQLNRTPEFDIIESLSHFYALLCRYFGLKSRLRLFLLDAMYCVKFKVVPLIKQCLDVWMHILPLAHMGIAKSPLVTCLVYLLHFYKCEDRFNRVQEIRTILSRKYFYQITDWNEKKILEMFKNAIKDVRDIPIEKKMLRIALIILGKRHGAKWCHKNIIKNMLMPMIEKEDISMKIKLFCVQLLGALIKPFPADMKVHFEIVVNHLHDMLQQDPPDAMKEAIFTSLIYINHHNPNRVIRSLLSWMPKQVSPEFEQLLRDYVRGKPVHTWKKILSKIPM